MLVSRDRQHALIVDALFRPVVVAFVAITAHVSHRPRRVSSAFAFVLVVVGSVIEVTEKKRIPIETEPKIKFTDQAKKSRAFFTEPVLISNYNENIRADPASP